MRVMFIIGLLLLGGCGKAPTGDVTELVYATPYSPSHPFSRADQAWMDFVNSRSGGTLVIKPSWAGALLSSEHSMEELRHGLADIGLITPIYVKGGAHLIRLQSGFYIGTTTMEAQLALYRCLESGNEQFAEELKGLKILAIQGGSLPGLVTTNKPVRSLDEMRGMRLRAPTELLGVLEALGADPVNMPMGDVYSALAKGVLDGVVAPLDTFRSLHFAEVADYYTELVVPRGAYPARAMGLARWNQLSAAHKQVLEEGIAVWEAALASQVELAMTEGLTEARDGGVEFLEFPGADQARFDELYLAQAGNNAASLARYDIDGMQVFDLARSSINDDGTVTCTGETD
jgi:TRAP-type C4-dicarboxylate transport system substrate-binding protein